MRSCCVAAPVCRKHGQSLRTTATVMFVEEFLGVPAPSLSTVELGDELSVFDAATGTALTLNRTASDVFALADGHTTVGEAVEVLARAYGVEAGEIADDVVQTVQRLHESGVLVASES